MTPRPPLDSQRVFQAWRADVDQHGRRGGYRRIAARYACSPERVRQIVQAQQPPVTPPPEDELAYTPPPFAYPAPQPRPQPDPLLSQLVLAEIMSPVTETASDGGDERQADELPEHDNRQTQEDELPEMLTTWHDITKALLIYGLPDDPVLVTEVEPLPLGSHVAIMALGALIWYGTLSISYAFALLPAVLAVWWFALPADNG